MSPTGRGWAVGKFGRIIHTSDGGTSWKEQKSGTHKPLTSISFAGELHGYAIGGAGTILATVDGGQSWKAQNSPTGEHLLEIYALTPRIAYIAGAFGTFLSTVDGGAGWAKHSLPWKNIVPRLTAEVGEIEPSLNTVHFLDDKEGLVAGEFGLILHTRDGARTWIARRYGTDLPQLVSVRFANSRLGWTVGTRGSLLRTKDGGFTWETINSGTDRDFYAVWIEKQQALIAGNGILLRTINGGLDWIMLPSVFGSRWLSGVAGTPDGAIVVGHRGARKITLASQPRKAAAP